MMPSKFAGFTLIEVMIVIVILGIISAIAFPAYTSQMQKVRRSDAIDLAMSVAQRMERCFTVDGAYSAGGSCPTGAQASTKGYYSGAIAIGSATTYTITVTPVAGQPQASDTHCASFVITQTGNKTATNTDCW